jgi:glycerol-3-phosphate acyltransferase PlsY
MSWLIWISIAYLCGSVPFGVLIARSKGVNIRNEGSGNIGATNVGRVLGRRFGIACFVLDGVKGGAPVLAAGIGQGIFGETPPSLHTFDSSMWLLTAIAAILGHCFSPWLGFKGGKGIATAFGAMLAIWPLMGIPALCALGVWAITLAITRVMAIASILGALTITVMLVIQAIVYSMGSSPVPILPYMGISIALLIFVIYTHRSNIARILSGSEMKV